MRKRTIYLLFLNAENEITEYSQQVGRLFGKVWKGYTAGSTRNFVLKKFCGIDSERFSLFRKRNCSFQDILSSVEEPILKFGMEGNGTEFMCFAHGTFRYFELCSNCLREGLGRSKPATNPWNKHNNTTVGISTIFQPYWTVFYRIKWGLQVWVS